MDIQATETVPNTDLDKINNIEIRVDTQQGYLGKMGDSFSATMREITSPETVGKVAAGVAAYYGGKFIFRHASRLIAAGVDGAKAGFKDFKEKVSEEMDGTGTEAVETKKKK